MEKNENFKEELETQYNILIKANEKKEKQRFLIVLIIVIITFIAVIISVIFSYKAYDTSKKVNDIKDNGSKIYYRTLSTTFNGDSKLNLTGIGNGYELTNPKVIQITNEGNNDITFDLKLVSINTSLLSTNNLIYTLTSKNEVSNSKELPLSDKALVQDVKIAPNETITYIINIKFTGVIEQNNYSNYYNAKILIEQKDNKANLLE